MTTYDTIIPYRGSGSASQNWVVRITRPVNFFTAGSADTASRPVIMTVQGDGEVSVGNYIFINHFGPHYILANNGWDGSVVLGNGTHYPILITVQQNNVNTKANLFQSLFDTLYKEFHPRSVHYAGLSGGVEIGGWLLMYQSTLGDEHMMHQIQSFTNLSGVAPSFPNGENEQGAQPLPYPQVWGYWAHKYGGRYWSTLGDADNQTSTYLIGQMMNDSVPNSAYYSWVNVDGGAHNGWNTQYDPTILNWTNQGTFGNSYIATSGNAPNTAGNYVYSATTGTALYQWMLRQGDTTLVGLQKDTSIVAGLGEYGSWYIQNGNWYGLGDISFIGNGFTGTPGLPYRVITAPVAGVHMAQVFGGLHNGAAIDSSGNLYITGDNNFGQQGQGNTSVNYFANKIQIDSLGNAFTNVNLFAFYYCSNDGAENGQGWYAAKTDGTLWMCGGGSFGMRGNGTIGSFDSVVSRPVPVPIPGNRIPKQIVGGQTVKILMTDGTVWSVGQAANTNDYGFTMSGIQYASLQQVVDSANNPLLHIAQIAGAMSYNFCLDSSNNLWGFGAFGNYMGGWGGFATGGGSTLNRAHNITDSILPYIGNDTIKKIITNQNATYILTKHGIPYSFGDNAQACIGNGFELNYFTTPSPFAWPFTTGLLLVKHPYRMSVDSNFVDIFTQNNFGFNVVLKQKDPITGIVKLYFNGRNKGGIAGNGVIQCSAGQSQLYPNANDVVWPTLINPLGVTGMTYVSCPVCQTNPSDSNCNNSGCSIPTTVMSPSAGSNQNITVFTAQLNGSASTSTGIILSYNWSQISGPNTAKFDFNSSVTPIVNGLTNGTYVFQNKITDNSRIADSATMTLVVGSTTPPTVNAGNDTTITINNTVPLLGSASGNGGATITSTVWTLVSGPNTPTIVGPTSVHTTVIGMIVGTYIFRLTATDSNGNTSNDTVTIVISSVGCNCYIFIHGSVISTNPN